MKIARFSHPWLVAMSLLSLSACTAPGERDNAGNDDLGAMREHRSGDIYAEMGKAYINEGQPAVALRKLKRGLELDPDNAQIHAVLGRLYQQLGESDAAAINYRKASEIEPQNPYFRNAWGSFLCQQGDYDKADEQFRLALKNPLYTQPWMASANAGVCALRAQREAQGEKYLRQALSLNPRIPIALLRMARITATRGEYATAKTYLERYRELVPHTADTLLLGLRIEQGLGDADGVARYRATLEQRFPDAPETQTAKELSHP